MRWDTSKVPIMSRKGDFDAVRKDIAKLMHQPEYDDGSAGPVLVRLAWYVLSHPHAAHRAVLASALSPLNLHTTGTQQEPTMPKQIQADQTVQACATKLKEVTLRTPVCNTLVSSSSQSRRSTPG